MIHPGAKLLYIYEPLKLENKLFTLKIQWRVSHGIIAMDILIPQERRRGQESSALSKFEIQPASSIH